MAVHFPMPVLPTPDYSPPLAFHSGNFATLYPPLLRPTPESPIARTERVDTPDNDFLDIDWHANRTGKTRRLAIISHGLEGHSRKKYVLGMARMATNAGFDAACWSQRSCSGEVNRLARSYHSGETNDLHTVITHCQATGRYDDIVLIGFSMGGNQILKYLGEAPERVPNAVKAAATFSVPCDLSATEQIIARPSMRIYLEYFMLGLRKKIVEKKELFPDEVGHIHLAGIKSLRDFDDIYTAPVNGFVDAADYYARSSCTQFIKGIRVPTLLVNARNDPFLASRCYPVDEAKANPNLFLEMPLYGGHVGFVLCGNGNVYWSEKRAKDFFRDILG